MRSHEEPLALFCFGPYAVVNAALKLNDSQQRFNCQKRENRWYTDPFPPENLKYCRGKQKSILQKYLRLGFECKTCLAGGPEAGEMDCVCLSEGLKDRTAHSCCERRNDPCTCTPRRCACDRAPLLLKKDAAPQ